MFLNFRSTPLGETQQLFFKCVWETASCEDGGGNLQESALCVSFKSNCWGPSQGMYKARLGPWLYGRGQQWFGIKHLQRQGANTAACTFCVPLFNILWLLFVSVQTRAHKSWDCASDRCVMIHTELSDTRGRTEETSCTNVTSRKVSIFRSFTGKTLIRLLFFTFPRTAKNIPGKWVLRLGMKEPYPNCS